MHGADHKPCSARVFVASRQRSPCLSTGHSFLVSGRSKQKSFHCCFLPLSLGVPGTGPRCCLPITQATIQLCSRQLPGPELLHTLRRLSWLLSTLASSSVLVALDCHKQVTCGHSGRDFLLPPLEAGTSVIQTAYCWFQEGCPDGTLTSRFP